MNAFEHLERFLDEKDAEIEHLRHELRAAQEAARVNHRWTAHSTSAFDPADQLPVPRLELRWVSNESDYEGYPWLVRYDLVKRHLLGHIEHIPLGSTKMSHAPDRAGGLLPYRDGAHIAHDAAHLCLPVYVSDENGNAQRLDMTKTHDMQVRRGAEHRTAT